MVHTYRTIMSEQRYNSEEEMTFECQYHKWELDKITESRIYSNIDNNKPRHVGIVFIEKCTRCNETQELLIEIIPDSSMLDGCHSSMWRTKK